jgi:hypothetical protein
MEGGTVLGVLVWSHYWYLRAAWEVEEEIGCNKGW